MGHSNNHVTCVEDQIILSLDIDWRVINLVPFQPNPHRFGVLHASESVSEQLKCHDSMRAIVVLLRERRFRQGLARSSEFRVLFRNLLLCKSFTEFLRSHCEESKAAENRTLHLNWSWRRLKFINGAPWLSEWFGGWFASGDRWGFRIHFLVQFSRLVLCDKMGGNKNCAILRKELLIVQLFANKKGKSTRVVWKLIDNYSNSTSETLLNHRRHRRCRLKLSLRRRWR